MVRFGALLEQRGVCGAGWGLMWLCGGGSEPLPAEPGAAADGAATAARHPLRGAAMGGDSARIHNIAAAAAAVHSAAAADSGCGDHHPQQPPPATVRSRQRWRRRWLLRRRMCLEGGGGGGGGLRGVGGSTAIRRRGEGWRLDASGWRRAESAERREPPSGGGGGSGLPPSFLAVTECSSPSPKQNTCLYRNQLVKLLRDHGL